MSDSDKENNEATAFLQDEDETPRLSRWVVSQSYHRRWCWWTAANVLLLVAFTAANLAIWSRHRPAIWSTDFPDARKAIEYEERMYTGALTYDPTQHQVLRLHDAKVEYVGPPSPEIDRAWDELLHDEFPTMSKEEAAPFLHDLIPMPKDGEYHFEPDVFHSLHCVNAIRNELNPVLYNVSNEQNAHAKMDQQIAKAINDPAWKTKHMEHCLDRIRQAIMCHGDLTPSPLYSWPGFPLSLGRSGTRTCRKWEPIREWMNQRSSNKKTFQPDKKV